MSEPYNVSIVKFTGDFSNLTQLNADLEANTSSEFMEYLIESASCSNISPLRLFAPAHYRTGMGMISQDEGSLDNIHYTSTRYHTTFDNSDCDIISSYLVPGSKLVISFMKEAEQTFYIFEHNTWKSIPVESLF